MLPFPMISEFGALQQMLVVAIRGTVTIMNIALLEILVLGVQEVTRLIEVVLENQA